MRIVTIKWNNLGIYFAVALLSFILGGNVAADLKTKVTPPKFKVFYPVKHDRTRKPLRDMPSAAVPDLGGSVVPIYPLPHRTPVDVPGKAVVPVLPESALPRMAPELTAPMPTPVLSFEGTNNVNGVAPPDTCGDVGPNHYVQAVNLSYQIFDKAGNSLYGPTPLNALWTGFGGICEILNNGDPIVLYDQWADRWLISQFALDYGGAGFHQCIAISRSGDPTGEWNRYDYKMSDTIMNDYPKFGVWPDGYYMSINQFNAASGYSWAGQGVAVFDRTRMLAGDLAAMQYLDLNTTYPDLSAMLPADADGMSQPAPGEPDHFVMFTDDSWGGGFRDQLIMYDFHVDWAVPGNSTFSPAAALDVEAFAWFPGGIDQPDTTVKVASLGDRLMYRLQYRNFGDHASMVVNHTVNSGSGVAGIRWYELQNAGAGWAIHQQGTHAPDPTHRWMGSIAMDQQGNIAAGYSVSNATDVYPSIRYAGRLSGDPLGTFAQTETELHRGTGSQTESLYHRWGDYSMMSVDPVDDCTFWYTQEYYQTTSTWGWQTRIGTFSFPSCTSGPVGSLSGIIRDSEGNPLADVLVTIDDGSGSLWSTVTAGDGSYLFRGVPDISPATYTVTAAKYSYAVQVENGVAIVIGGNIVRDFVLSLLPVYSLSGTVSDAATGWPLYAQVEFGHGSVWTDPLTGNYNVELPEGDFALTVTSSMDGYDPAVRSITLNSARTEDFFLAADPVICDAPGYRFPAPLVQEFTRCGLPDGWIVKNNGGDCAWREDNPGGRTNLTGGAGCFVVADSDYCGNGTNMDTELISPSFDGTGLSSLTLEFKYDVYRIAATTRFEVDVSSDGGVTWSNVWQRIGVDDRGPRVAMVDISALADNQPDVRVRFHYTTLDRDWWWQVDDVYVYQSPKDATDLTSCTAPTEGGLVFGNVYDDNTLKPLNNALVSDGAGHTAISKPTPDDNGASDGFYSLYVPVTGSIDMTASLDAPKGYGVDSHTVFVPTLGGVVQDFLLPAANLRPTPASVEIFVRPDDRKSMTVQLDNTGLAAGSYKFIEVNSPLSAPVNGPFADTTRHMSPKHLDDTDPVYARYDYPVLATIPVVTAPGDVIGSWNSGLVFPWGVGFDRNAGTVWLGNLAVGGGDDLDYEFATDGTPTGRAIDVSSLPQVFMADLAYDQVRETLWQMNVGGGNCIHELDPVTLKITGEKICPGYGLSQRGLAYNVKTDTFYAGSWNDSTIYEFTRNGVILRSVDVGLPISGLAFNPATDHLLVMNDTSFPFQIAVLDALNNFTPLYAYAIAGFSTNGGAGLAMDNQGNLWAADKKSATVFQVDSGEPSPSIDIPWLTVTPLTGTVAGNSTQSVNLDFAAAGLTAGKTMEGYLILHDDTPYSAQFMSITMHVVDLPLVVSTVYGEVTKKSAKVTAEVDPQCLDTEYYFEYGTVEGVYDQRTASVFSSSCSPVTLEFLLSGLAQGTMYYGRLAAINTFGTTYGSLLIFTTHSFPWILFLPTIAQAEKNLP